MPAQDAKRAFEEIRAFCQARLEAFWRDALAASAERLRTLAADFAVETSVREAAEAAEAWRAELDPDWPAQAAARSVQTLAGERAVQRQQPADTLSLSLVDDELLDEMLLVGQLAGRIQDSYEQHLKALKRGLVRLGKKLEREPQPEALAPQKLLMVLHEALEGGGLALGAKRLLYEDAAAVLEGRVADLYAGVLALLQEAGELAEHENPASEHFQPLYDFRANRGVPAPARPAAPPAGEAPPAAAAPPPVVPPVAPYQPLAPARLAPLAAQAFAPGRLAPSGALSQAVLDFLARPVPPRTDAAGRPLPQFAQHEVGELLDSLQGLNDEHLAQQALQDPQAIARQVERWLEQVSRERAKQFSAPETQVIELVNRLFATLLDSPLLIDPVKVQIGRLQIPYLKAALLDVTLLNEPAHPARLLLNELARAGERVDRADDPLLKWIREAVARIAGELADDLGLFTEVLESFRERLAEAGAAAEEAERGTREQAASQARTLFGKRQVVQHLRRQLRGKVLPPAIHDLILKGFAPALLRIHRKFGGGDERWRNALAVVRRVVESVQPRDSAYAIDRILARREKLLAQTQTLLQALPDKREVPAWLTALDGLYEALAERRRSLPDPPPGLPAEQRVDPLAGLGAEEDAPELQDQPSPAELVARLPEAVQPGTWCEVYSGHNRPPRRLKVSAVLHDTAQLVFVDGGGIQAQIKDVAEFLDELDCERSRILADEALFDKALAAVINNLNVMRAVS